MKFGERYENIFAAGLILSFFLPWISFGGFFSINGLDMPTMLSGLGKIAKGFSGKENADTAGTGIFYIFYLIPILGLIYALINYGGKVINLLSIGGYLTILCGIGMLLAAFGVIKPKVKQSETSQ